MLAYQSGDLPKPAGGPRGPARGFARGTHGHYVFRIEGLRTEPQSRWEKPVVLKLHSSQSRNRGKYWDRTAAATEIHLNDAEAIHLARALLVAMGNADAANPDVDPLILLRAVAVK